MKCILCGNEIKSGDIYVPIGLDGDFAHKHCEEHKEDHYAMLDNMSTDRFIDWLLSRKNND